MSVTCSVSHCSAAGIRERAQLVTAVLSGILVRMSGDRRVYALERVPLQEAHTQTKRARGELAVALSAVRSNLLISRAVQRRAALASMLSAARQLQRINHMRHSVM